MWNKAWFRLLAPIQQPWVPGLLWSAHVLTISLGWCPRSRCLLTAALLLTNETIPKSIRKTLILLTCLMPQLRVAVRFVNKLMSMEKAVRKITPFLPNWAGVLCLHTDHLLGVLLLSSRNLLGRLTSTGYCLVYFCPKQSHIALKGHCQLDCFSERHILNESMFGQRAFL